MNIVTSLSMLSNIGIVILGCYLVWDSQITMGSIIACSILSGRLTGPIMQITSILTRYHQAKCSLVSLNTIMNTPDEGKGFQRFYHINKLEGEINFDGVSFNYEGQGNSFIKELSLNIKKGEKVAILGNSGSGKTTLFSLLTGLQQASDGTITIDKMNLHQVDPFVLRSNIGYVEQNIQLFSGTLWENIVFKNPDAEEEDVKKAIEISGVDSFALGHPDGYNMVISEGGKSLSGGQAQAVAIARSLLLDPAILILDEPTSAMDNVLEKNFTSKLEKYAKDKTLIISTHKMSLLSLVDRVIIINNGNIIADGDRDEVFKKINQ